MIEPTKIEANNPTNVSMSVIFSQIETELKNITEKVLIKSNLRPNDHLGVTVIDSTEILMDLEERFPDIIPVDMITDTEFEKCQTLNDMMKLIREKCKV